MPAIAINGNKEKRLRLFRFLCLGCLLVYALAFFLPTFFILVEGRRHVYYGVHAFYLSVFAYLFVGIRPSIAWFANPMFCFGSVYLWRGKPGLAFVAGIIATGLAGSLGAWGDSETADAILSGYYVWVLSMAMLAVASAFAFVIAELDRLAKPINR